MNNQKIEIKDIILKMRTNKYVNLREGASKDLRKIGTEKEIRKALFDYEFEKYEKNRFVLSDFKNYLKYCGNFLSLVVLPIFLGMLSTVVGAGLSDAVENKNDKLISVIYSTFTISKVFLFAIAAAMCAHYILTYNKKRNDECLKILNRIVDENL